MNSGSKRLSRHNDKMDGLTVDSQKGNIHLFDRFNAMPPLTNGGIAARSPRTSKIRVDDEKSVDGMVVGFGVAGGGGGAEGDFVVAGVDGVGVSFGAAGFAGGAERRV